MELGLGNVLVVLVLKNDAECTSRRVKRTSGARVLIIEFSSISACRSEVRRGAVGTPPPSGENLASAPALISKIYYWP